MDAVRLDGVTKRFGGTVAVDALSLAVPRGSVYGFIGPNGSGKTTTLRMILHVIHPDEGRVEVLGELGTRAANDRVGYLPEERGLYRKLTVRRQLVYAARLKGRGAAESRAAADDWLERLGLAAWADKKIETLSKGMAQKVQFIGAVLTRPELLVLDEPFSGLDPVNLEVLRGAILDLHRQGATIIFSTHDMSTAEKLCDRILMIFKGRKVLDGTLAEIQERYGQDCVRLTMDGGRELLDGHPAVESVLDMGRYQEVRLRGDSQELLQHLAQRTRVHRFEVSRPSLHDVFVRIAGPASPTDPAEPTAPAEPAAPTPGKR